MLMMAHTVSSLAAALARRCISPRLSAAQVRPLNLQTDSAPHKCGR